MWFKKSHYRITRRNIIRSAINVEEVKVFLNLDHGNLVEKKIQMI